MRRQAHPPQGQEGPVVQRDVMELMVELTKANDTAVLLISHDLGMVARYCSRIVVMCQGDVVEQGRSEDILARPQHPYTRALLRSVLTPEPGAGVPDIGLKGGFPDPLNPPKACVFHPRCPDAKPVCAATTPALKPVPGGAAACHLVEEEPHVA